MQRVSAPSLTVGFLSCASDLIQPWVSSATHLSTRDALVLSFASRIQKSFLIQSGEDLWLTKKNARTHRARARRKKAESIAALPARARVTQSSWIAIAVTKSVRGISKTIAETRLLGRVQSYRHEMGLCALPDSRVSAFDYFWRLAIITARCSAIAGSSA